MVWFRFEMTAEQAREFISDVEAAADNDEDHYEFTGAFDIEDAEDLAADLRSQVWIEERT